MKLIRRILLSLPLLHLGASVALPAEGLMGRTIEDFRLEDWQGQPYRLSDQADAQAIVVAFLGVECPLAKTYASRLVELERAFRERGVAVVAIDANEQDSLSEMGQFARVQGFTFPLLKDPGQKVADQFGAERTPEFFVLDPGRVIRYHGRFDDQFGVGYQRPAVARNDLSIALSELLGGRPVAVPETPAPGCLIGRLREVRDDAPVTWSNQIVRIMQKHCQSCHRPNEIGPFALTEYAEAVGWAGMIQEVVEQGRMPPWHASPDYGEFLNQARLSDKEKEQIAQWVADGAPEGDPAELPPPREFGEGWEIGTPDVVFYNAEEPEEIPATGTVDYHYYVVDSGFEEGKWVAGFQVRPTNLAVVHHVSVYLQAPGEPWIDAFRHVIAGYQPGGSDQMRGLPGNIAQYIPAGSRFVVQVHYTPSGTPQKCRISLGLKFADPETVEREVRLFLIANQSFKIPPHANDFPVEAAAKMGSEVQLIGFVPHMHLRGKDFRVEAQFPDGTRETLLFVPKWDFNWQHAYIWAHPRMLPQGTLVRCLAHYDNSDENAANPDPTATVEFGHQTWDEMMDGYMAVTVPVDPALREASHTGAVAALPADPKANSTYAGAERWPWFALVAIPLFACAVTAVERWRGAGRSSKASSDPGFVEEEKTPKGAMEPPTKPGFQRSGRWALILLILLGLALPAWLLIDSHRAVARGWRFPNPRAQALVEFGAWGLLLAAWAVACVGPLRRLVARHATSLVVFTVFGLAIVALVECFPAQSSDDTAFHLHRPNSAQIRPFGPGAIWGSVRSARAHYNADGVQGRELPPGESTERILCLGGSSTESPYLDDQQTWPLALEQRFSDLGGRSMWVGNAGKTDLTTADHLRFLEQSELPRKMDALVLMVGMDDLWHTLTERPVDSPQAPAWFESRTATALLGLGETEVTSDAEDQERSDAFWERRRDPSFPPRPETMPDLEESLAGYRARLEKIAAWGRRNDVRIVFVTQPVLWDPSISPAARKRLSIAQVLPVGKEWTFLTSDRLRKWIDRYNDTLRSVCRETDTPCIDLANELNGQEFFFLDDYHFNAEGCRRAARILADRLEADNEAETLVTEK